MKLQVQHGEFHLVFNLRKEDIMEPPGKHSVYIVKKVFRDESVFCPDCEYRRDIDVKLLKVRGDLVFARCIGRDKHIFWATKDEIKRE